MSVLDVLTGGQNEKASRALEEAQNRIGGVKVPDAAQLSLPELQKLVVAGVMTPAQAEAALVKSDAYQGIPAGGPGLDAETAALSKLQDISESGGMDAEARATLNDALEKGKIQGQGSRGYIMDQMAARGIPTSLMGEAAQLAEAGQESEAASQAGVQAASQAEQRALTALSESAGLGGQIQSEQFGEASKKADAANAIAQWNAQNQTNTNVTNAGLKQQANLVNTTNAQDVSNQNTGLANERTKYNATVPQMIFNDQLGKTTAQAGVSAKQADQATEVGKQNAGLWGGILGAGATVGGDYLQGKATGDALAARYGAPTPVAHGGEIGMEEGGSVPGRPTVPGDSVKNDKVHALLSPGEVVVPRTIAPHPEAAKAFIQHVMRNKMPVKPVHPEDVRLMLDALTKRREVA